MSYFVLCTFDLKDASYQDYQNAYADLEKDWPKACRRIEPR